MTLKLEGYNSEGADTYGASYAREHPDDLPDGFVADIKMQFGYRHVKTGTLDTVQGIPVRVVAGKAQHAIVLDTRKVGAEELDKELPIGRLIRWHGMYWRVHSVRGVFVQLGLWGTKRRRTGWRLYTRAGMEFAEPVRN